MSSILLAVTNLFASGIDPVIVSAWGAGGAGGNVNSSGDGEDGGPGGNGAFVEFRIEGLKGTETIYAYPGGGGSAFADQDDGDAGGGGAATLVYITNGVSTDYLCVVGGGAGGGGVGADPDNHDATAGGEGGAAGGNGAGAQSPGKGAIGGGGGTQSAGGTNTRNSTANPPTKGTYAQNGGVGLRNVNVGTGGAGAGGVVGHSFGGAGGQGGLEDGNEGGGGGGGGGWFGGAGGTGDDGGNDAGAGGGGGSTKLNTSPSGFSYLTITQISTSAGTASPNVQYDGSASTQSAGSTNEFSASVGGQAGRGGQTNGAPGLGGSNGRVAIGLEGGTATINTTSTSGASSLASNL